MGSKITISPREGDSNKNGKIFQWTMVPYSVTDLSIYCHLDSLFSGRSSAEFGFSAQSSKKKKKNGEKHISKLTAKCYEAIPDTVTSSPPRGLWSNVFWKMQRNLHIAKVCIETRPEFP